MCNGTVELKASKPNVAIWLKIYIMYANWNKDMGDGYVWQKPRDVNRVFFFETWLVTINQSLNLFLGNWHANSSVLFKINSQFHVNVDLVGA